MRTRCKSMRCMHSPPLSLPPVPELKALEPESQEPECNPLPRTPPALSQRHEGQSLQSDTPSTLSSRCLWMSCFSDPARAPGSLSDRFDRTRIRAQYKDFGRREIGFSVQRHFYCAVILIALGWGLTVETFFAERF